MLLIPSAWKEVVGVANGDTEFDLANGTLSIVEEAGDIKVRQAPSPADPWGESCVQVASAPSVVNASKVVITGKHKVTGRPFEIICEQVLVWKQSGVLQQLDGGGNGTWTAEEG